jgi:hypothetical protein
MFTKEQSMRHILPTKQKLVEGQQTVFFQIEDGNARHACSLKTKFRNYKLLAISAKTGTGSRKWLTIAWRANASRMARLTL